MRAHTDSETAAEEVEQIKEWMEFFDLTQRELCFLLVPVDESDRTRSRLKEDRAEGFSVDVHGRLRSELRCYESARPSYDGTIGVFSYNTADEFLNGRYVRVAGSVAAAFTNSDVRYFEDF